MPNTLRIGTRGSQLSLWQANHIGNLLRARFSDIEIEIVTIKTRGDADRVSPLPAIGGAGVFTSELENALRRGTRSIAPCTASKICRLKLTAQIYQ